MFGLGVAFGSFCAACGSGVCGLLAEGAVACELFEDDGLGGSFARRVRRHAIEGHE